MMGISQIVIKAQCPYCLYHVFIFHSNYTTVDEIENSSLLHFLKYCTLKFRDSGVLIKQFSYRTTHLHILKKTKKKLVVS